jgi:hypothetical protein
VARPTNCTGARAVTLLDEMAAAVFESLRTYLHANPERRCQERWPFERDAEAVLEGAEEGAAVACRTRDLSLHGMGLLLPCRPPQGEVLVRLHTAHGWLLELAGRIVHIAPAANGAFEVGVSFETGQ